MPHATDDRGWPDERPSTVQITVIPGPRGRPGRDRATAPRLRAVWPLVVGVLALGAIAALAAGVVAGTRTRTQAVTLAARIGASAPAGVAAAYHYPLACLTVTVSPTDPVYASARLDRASPCWRIGAYGTAIFRRVGGAWRLLPHSTGYACPIASMPAAAQAELGLCPTSGGGSAPPPWAAAKAAAAIGTRSAYERRRRRTAPTRST